MAISAKEGLLFFVGRKFPVKMPEAVFVHCWWESTLWCRRKENRLKLAAESILYHSPTLGVHPIPTSFFKTTGGADPKRKDVFAWPFSLPSPCEPKPFIPWCSYCKLLQLQRTGQLGWRGRMRNLVQGSALLLHRSRGL